MVGLFLVHKQKSSSVDLSTSVLDGKAYVAEPSYGLKMDLYRHLVSVVVFSTIHNPKFKSMTIDYAVTEFGCFDHYSDASPVANTMRGNGITVFLLHVAQCIVFEKSKIKAATLVANIHLKGYYSKLGFKVIKDFDTLESMKIARERFHYEANSSQKDGNITIGMQCNNIIPRKIQVLFDNRIKKEQQGLLYNALDTESREKNWFSMEYVRARVVARVTETKQSLQVPNRKKNIQKYIKVLSHNSKWLSSVCEDINRLLMERDYIKFFIDMYMQWVGDDGSLSVSHKLDIQRLPRFESFAFSQFQVYLDSENSKQHFHCRNCKRVYFIQYTDSKANTFSIMHLLRLHTGVRKFCRRNLYDLHLEAMNPFGVSESCAAIKTDPSLFEKYRVALTRDRYDIDLREDDAIERYKNFFYFVNRSFKHLGYLFNEERFHIIAAMRENAKFEDEKQLNKKSEKILKKKRKEREAKARALAKTTTKTSNEKMITPRKQQIKTK